MAITSMLRDWADGVSILRIVSTDTQAQVGAANYLTTQAANILKINEGPFEYSPSDFALVYASDGWAFYSVKPDYTGLTLFSSTTGVTGPTVVGDLAQFNSTTGNLIDNGLLPSNAASKRIVMAGSATLVNYLAHFTDTTGTVDDTPANVTNAGNIQAGLSGTAGSLASYPATAATGALLLAGVSNAGNFNVTLSNASHAQATVYSIPDVGAATGQLLVKSTAVPLVNGNLLQASGTAGKVVDQGFAMKSVAAAPVVAGNPATVTDAFCTTGSNVVATWNTQASNAAIWHIVPGNGSFVVTSSADQGIATLNYIITK